ncbi:hypothetical protein PV327_002875 [Microctonus hyperodae]|uniref:Dynein heavy chain tail domain-containing protein n=1 Tax=Microctonus hyperodae TaxID=165561 RepID=A0AA39FGX5_MICHY|nr:hypothetical protein PV327_002875 [Microctonus hyperodae]
MRKILKTARKSLVKRQGLTDASDCWSLRKGGARDGKGYSEMVVDTGYVMAGPDSPTDHRLEYLGSCIQKSLKLKPEKWGRLLLTEEYRNAVLDFLDNPTPAALFVVLTPNAQLIASCSFPIPCQRTKVLPMPAGLEKVAEVERLVKDEGPQAVDLYLKSAIEGVVIKWAYLVNDVVTQESIAAFENGQNPTPTVELEYWSKRLTNLRLFSCSGLLQVLYISSATSIV